MNTFITSSVIGFCLCGAVWLGARTRRYVPEHQLSDATQDAIKIAMGLIATMSALVLGLLVSSAKESYDTVRSEVIQMAAKVTFLDRVLKLYGPDAAELRASFHTAVGDVARQMWADAGGAAPPHVQTGDALYVAIQGLSPRDDSQQTLKQQAMSLAAELGQLRTLMHAQSVASISRPLLVVVVSWLAIIFFSFSLLAPPNLIAKAALTVSALSVTGAIFLILEMDRPFTGLIRISNQPMVNALNQSDN